MVVSNKTVPKQPEWKDGRTVMTITSFLLTLLPIAVLLVMLLVFKKPADISGIVGWVVISLVAIFAFQTTLAVVFQSTLAGVCEILPGVAHRGGFAAADGIH